MAKEIQKIQSYGRLLRQVKQRVALAQQRVIYAANEELLRMYWDLGQMLHAAQQAEGWGKGTLVRLSQDLKNEYPKEKGFSERNLRCMMEFYQEYNQELTMVKSNAKPPVSHLTAGKAILQPTVAELREHAITQPTVAKLSEYNFTLPIRNEYQKIKVLLEWMGINYNDFLYGLDHVVQVCDKIDRLEPI